MRRALAFLTLLIATTAGDAKAQQQALAAPDLPYKPLTTYTILRNGEPIGTHTLRFERSGAQRVVTARIEVLVKVLGVNAYRLTHEAREVWLDGQLQRLDTRTDNNGRHFTVRAHRSAAGLVVERERPAESSAAAAVFQGFAAPEIERVTLPAGTLPTSLWNIRQVGQSTLLHTQHGRLARTRIEPSGREVVRIASGPVEATHYTYSGDLRMHQWFDDRGRWVRSAFQAFDGSSIECILQE